MNATIQKYEELSLNSFPALQTQLYDGWVLRFANGFNNRANSVSLLHESTLDWETKVCECEKRYAAQGLPTVFKVTDAAETGFDCMLEEQGYEVVTPTNFMVMNMHDKEFAVGSHILENHASEEWLNAYFLLSKYDSNANKMYVSRQIAVNTKSPAVYAQLEKGGKPVACGSSVIELGHMALLNITVDENNRRKGYGYELCQLLLAAAKGMGAHTAYLQVEQANQTAVNLYTKLGYKKVYTYWYRVKKQGGI